MREFPIKSIDSDTINRLASLLGTSVDEDVVIKFYDIGCCPRNVVPLAAIVDFYRLQGKEIRLVFEASREAEFVFTNRDINQPFGSVWRFDNPNQMDQILDALGKEILKLPKIGKGFKQAFTWCIGEIMDNVLQHSQENKTAKSVGYAMIQYVYSERLLKSCVFDLGIGLYESFKNSKYAPRSPLEAVGLAVQPNITSGNGQGNGLYGLRELVKQSDFGRLEIKSAGARYIMEKGAARLDTISTIPGFPGCVSVDFQMNFEDDLRMEDVFPDAIVSSDPWMEEHEIDDKTVVLKVLEVVNGTISRDFGREMRNAVENVIDNAHKRVIIDFAGVELCSSAFVDELIGKLLERFQFVRFSQYVAVANLSGINALLVNHSIRQRLGDVTSALQVNDSSGVTEIGPTGPASIGAALPGRVPEIVPITVESK